MKATLRDDKLISLPIENTPLFKRFEGGIGWMDPTEQNTKAQHWFVVAAEQTNGDYVMVAEASATHLLDLAEKATNWKDRLLIRRIWADQTEEGYLRTLQDTRQCDGLCGYHTVGKTLLGKPKYAHKSDRWPYFRDRSTIASIVYTDGAIESGFDLVRRLAQRERISFRDTVPWSKWILRQRTYVDVIEHPLLAALVYVISGMESTKRLQEHTQQPRPWYQNPKPW
jgi:hypothetical protein